MSKKIDEKTIDELKEFGLTDEDLETVLGGVDEIVENTEEEKDIKAQLIEAFREAATLLGDSLVEKIVEYINVYGAVAALGLSCLLAMTDDQKKTIIKGIFKSVANVE